MLRFLFRLLFPVLLFVIGKLLTAGRSRPREAPKGGRGGAGRDAGAGGAGARRAGPHPPLDRSDVLDVPFTEVPPPRDVRAPES